ncbi:MAG: BACON domain-containing protein [Thermoanaerobaculia bacterium]
MSNRRLSVVLVLSICAMTFTIAAGAGSSFCPANAFPIANSSQQELSFGVAFDGTNFLVGIQGDAIDRHDIGGQFVSPAGTLVGSRIRTGRTGGAPSVAFGGTSYLLVWPDDAYPGPDAVYGMFVSTAGAPLGSPFVISQGSQAEEPAGVAFDGTRFLVAYTVGSNDPSAVSRLAARFVASGGAVGAEMTLASNVPSKILSSVAFNGSNYLVAWTEHIGVNQNIIQGRLVSKAGDFSGVITIDPEISPNAMPLSAIAAGTDFLVAFGYETSPGNGNPAWEVRGRVVTGLGAVDAPVFTIAGGPGPRFPTIAFDGSRCLVAWTEVSDPANWDVVGRFLSATGTPLGESFNITPCPGNQGLSPVAFGGGKFLVMWDDGITNTAGNPQLNELGFGDVGGTFIAAPAGCPRGCVASVIEPPVAPVNGRGLTQPHIDSLSTTAASPFSLLTISGSGFDLPAALTVRFSDSLGFAVGVPLVAATSTSLTVAIPPYLDPQTGSIASGNVNVRVVRSAGTTSVSSNVVGGFQIQGLPVPNAPAGAITLSLLKATVGAAQALENDVNGTSLNTPALRAALSNEISSLTPFIASVDDVVKNPSHSFSLGTVGGSDVAVTSSRLRTADQMLIGMAMAIGTTSEFSLLNERSSLLSGPRRLASASACMGSEAGLFATAGLQYSPQLNDDASNLVSASETSAVCSSAAAFDLGYTVVAAAGAVGIGLTVLTVTAIAAPEIAFAAVALPSAALLAVTIEGAGGMIAVGGALNQTTPGAVELVQGGAEKINELMLGTLKVFLPQTVSAVILTALGANSLIEAFTSAPPLGSSGGVCTYSLSPAGNSLGAEGGGGAVTVMAGSGCAWASASNSSWIEITSGSSGTGIGTLGYFVAANGDGIQRTGTMTVAGQAFTVTQAGASASPFDGSYLGSYVGTYYPGGGSASPISGLLAFTDANGVISETQPDSGSGTLSSAGSADFGGADGNNGTCTFTGNFVASGTGGVTASGSFSCAYGGGGGDPGGETANGTWSAVKQ